jgi:hypothetical protein
MSEHTPQPWTARRDDSGGEPGLWSVIGADGSIVFFGLMEDDARLIAAAPEMLETLRAFDDAYSCEDGTYADKINRANHLMLAAIAKAEGRDTRDEKGVAS